ncbi:DUF4372 domain-containing protein [Endozoicomonas numazuensis]|uniref:DUF4372 domain-containing protein n=1 Tax=Endozoicomonas numazuensis TaxID=1137799 RepID=A0A081NJZ0_9GAMM|nr:DUF4372 domain-containing protein [Endozoicomonas numazuensis]KEQ18763.1 hypothetical protein GZ78_01330 [Endozoicomonas numazuensis]
MQVSWASEQRFPTVTQSHSRHQFQKVFDRHNGDHRIRTLSCWTQLVAMMLAQLTRLISTRDLVENFNTCHSHHYHLGVSRIKRSSLSDANSHRTASIFSETSFFLLQKVRSHLPQGADSDMVRLIDSTTIDLNVNPFEWTHFRKTKGGIIYTPCPDHNTVSAVVTANSQENQS